MYGSIAFQHDSLCSCAWSAADPKLLGTERALSRDSRPNKESIYPATCWIGEPAHSPLRALPKTPSYSLPPRISNGWWEFN